MDFKIENCANSLLSAINAQEAGADRVELCAGMPEGGTTPSYGTIVSARKALQKTLLHVIIRPRGGDFLYCEEEIQTMLADIALCRRVGVDGVVLGCLKADGSVDEVLMRRLISAAREDSISGEPMSVTFHRAFDMVRDPFGAMRKLIELRVDRILTSGCQQTAEKGLPLLRELVREAAGRIIIMPGCGVNAENIARIALCTGAREFHLSGRSSVESGMTYRNPTVSMGGTVCIDEYSSEITDVRKILAARDALSEIKM